jgi:hypothetical protein
MVAVPHPAATGAESETLNDEGTRRRFARDSPLEESGFEPLVPVNLRRRRFSEHLFGLPGLQALEDGPLEDAMRSDQPF